jgi:hypothetical protein
MAGTLSDPRDGSDFAARAAEPRTGTFGELIAYMSSTRKWWLTPIIITLVAIGGLVLLSSTAAAPFIYTLF